MKRIKRPKVKIFAITFVLAIFFLQACLPQTETPQASPTPDEAPTLTSTPEAPTALPTATKTPISNTPTPTPVPTEIKKVVLTVSGGNLNVRRGPRLTYNYVGVLYDGDVAVAVGRDRVGNWLLIELPSNPSAMGWVTTETIYSAIEGDILALPLVEVEPPSPAFIRNCTKHTILVEPAGAQLLNKYNAPDNEGFFGVSTYQIYDLDVTGEPRLEDVTLSEGKQVDIIYDGNGDKSKCE